MSSTFDATVRRSGNSLVVTIPRTTIEAHKIKNGAILKVTVQLMGDKEEKS